MGPAGRRSRRRGSARAGPGLHCASSALRDSPDAQTVPGRDAPASPGDSPIAARYTRAMAIGVFDSGVGGLSVHHRLVERFPLADFVYLADQANTPYGGRPGEEIVDLTRAGCERLFAEGCDLIVLACNTASGVALRRLQQTWLDRK